MRRCWSVDAQEGLERTQEVRVGIASGVLADVKPRTTYKVFWCAH